MKKIVAFTIALIAGVILLGNRQSESSPTGRTSQPAHLDLDSQIPGNPESIAEAGPAQIHSQSASIPQSPATASALSDLPNSEQKSLWKAFSEARREVRPIPAARARRPENRGFDFYALHPKQDLTTRFGSEGVQIVSSDRTYTEADSDQASTSWQAEMRLLTFAGHDIPLSAPARKSDSSTSRVEYRHTSALTEWYDNGVAAMEHGYTVANRPAHLNAGEDVTIEVALNGLQAAAHTAEDGTYRLNFNEGERTLLSYSKLLVVDAQGKELPATMKATDAGFSLAYNDTQAAYPVTVDPLIVNEEAKLTRFEGASGDWFGYSVAISGDSAVIGAYGDDDAGSSSGSAYVFTRSGTSWLPQAKLTADDAAAADVFGFSVAISGDSVIVGAYLDDDDGDASGSAYVFTRSGSSWSQQAQTDRERCGGD